MTKIDESKLNKQVYRICNKFKTRYPHLYGTSGSRFIRQIVSNVVAETLFTKQGNS